MTLDQIRKDAEARNQAIGREYYPHGAGLRDSLDLATVMNQFAALNDRATIGTILQAMRAEQDPLEARRLANLLGDCLEGYLNTEIAHFEDLVATAESRSKVEVNGQAVPYRQAVSLISNTHDRLERLAIEKARWNVAQQVNLHRRAALEKVRTLIRQELGYEDYISFYQTLKGVDFYALDTLMGQFLADTDALYHARLEIWLREELQANPDECYRHDISYIMRAARFDPYFPEDKLLETLQNTLKNLGIDMTQQTNITWDIEKRPTKAPRAFVVATAVPQEVFLVVQPKGGRDDYAALLHESGHAEHFGNTDPELPYEFRFLGDYAVTECFAFTMELLTLDANWLKQNLDMPESVIKPYQEYMYTVLLYLVRRFASKLRYELALHDNQDLDGKEHLYSQIMEAHLVVKHDPTLYLSDVDPGFYCANYLRAWIMWAQLRRYLVQNFGADWFNCKDAGAFLMELWRTGQSLTGEELVQRLGYDGLDIGPLKEELFSVFGMTAMVNGG